MARRWLLVLAFLFVLAPASAAGLSVSYTPINDNVAYNGAAKYIITVTNNQKEADSICLKTPDWGTAIYDNYILGAAASSSVSTTLTMTPPSDVYVGQYAIEVIARSCTKPEASGSVLLKVNVNSELPHIEPVVDLPQGLRPHEYVMNIILKNNGKDSVDNLRGTVYSDLFGEKTFTADSVEALGAKVVLQAKVTIDPKATIGKHRVYITIYQGDKIIKRYTKNVEIVSEENIAVSKNMRRGIISKTYEVKLTNVGNLAVDDFYIETLPSWTRFFLSTEPKATVNKIKGDGVTASWYYSLAPAEEATIIYTVSYLPFIILLIIFGVVAYGVSRQFGKEFVIKKSVVKEGGAMKIKVSIKNVSDKQIMGVTVSDSVPTPLRLVKDFGTANPTVIKKEDGIIRVIWKFDVIYPNEERLLVYGLKTALSFVGEASLPPAELKFKKEGKQRAIQSNTVSVKGHVSVSED